MIGEFLMEEKVKEIMGKIFSVDKDAITNISSPDNIEKWDSLRHMQLVIALEKEFNVQLEEQQILEMMNFRLVVLTLEEQMKPDK